MHQDAFIGRALSAPDALGSLQRSSDSLAELGSRSREWDKEEIDGGIERRGSPPFPL